MSARLTKISVGLMAAAVVAVGGAQVYQQLYLPYDSKRSAASSYLPYD